MVLGKYSFTDGSKSELKNYDEYDITVSDEVYNDALELAKDSGKGLSDFNFDDIMVDFFEPEDVPDVSFVEDIIQDLSADGPQNEIT